MVLEHEIHLLQVVNLNPSQSDCPRPHVVPQTRLATDERNPAVYFALR
jgi:hypothetical protein